MRVISAPEPHARGDLKLPAHSAAAAGTLIKALGVEMLPRGLRYRERFELAARAGFRHLEMHTVPDPAEAEEVARAARQAGLKIHAVVVKCAGRVPYYAGEAKEVEAAVAAALTSLRNAAAWGADVVLLVPALVRGEMSYEETRAVSRGAGRSVGGAHGADLPAAPRTFSNCPYRRRAGQRRHRAEARLCRVSPRRVGALRSLRTAALTASRPSFFAASA